MGLLERAQTISESPPDKKKSKSRDEWLNFDDLITGTESTGTSGPVDAPPVETPDNDTDFSESRAIVELMTYIQNTSPDLQTPLKTFKLLCELFHINKGALLLKEYVHHQYNAWSFTGYDKTTQNRLRISQEAVSTLFTGRGDDFFFTKEQSEILRPYFSIREYSLIDEICVYPFLHDGQIIGLLLISESPVIENQGNSFFHSFGKLFSQLSFLLYSSRDVVSEKTASYRIKTNENLLQEIESAISSSQQNNTKTIFLTLSVVQILNSIFTESEGIDISQIQNDITRLLTAMMPESDKVFLIEYGTLLIILSGRYNINKKLFLHQIMQTLRQSFSSITIDEPEETVFIVYPDEVESPNDIIQRILP